MSLDFLATILGLDGPEAPIADPSTYEWPESAEEATAERLARVSVAAGLQHSRLGRPGTGRPWQADAVAANALADRAVLLLALAKLDPARADEVARDLWRTVEADNGTDAWLTYAARAMGIPSEEPAPV